MDLRIHFPGELRSFYFIVISIAWGCISSGSDVAVESNAWDISILPPSIRLDPASGEIIESRFILPAAKANVSKESWIYDGSEVTLHAARGEYVSFQLVLNNLSGSAIRDISIEATPFRLDGTELVRPELFLEWAVEVKTPSTGYPRASLGKGWYPDALIPLDQIQADSGRVTGRWVYPLELPDFNNRIDEQKAMLIWLDQYVPYPVENAPPGEYAGEIAITVAGERRVVPVKLVVWDFSIPNQNLFKASLQHEGFLSGKEEEYELEIYQLFKRNRISLMDPTYKPELQISAKEGIKFNWKSFDSRLSKFFSGAAFTKAFGYPYGPGYGEPIEAFIVPFNVRGKHGNKGWPDVGGPKQERRPENEKIYREVIRQFRDHIGGMINPEKTEVTIYLNGLDESYFPEAWDRMVYYGNMFKEEYPGARFRIDGAYSEEAMGIVMNSIDSWASHTLNYDAENIRKYQDMGIEDWLYGPLLYESKVNSWVGSSTFIDLPLINDRAISWSCWKYGTYSWISWGIGASWERGWHDPESWKDRYKHGADSDPGYFFKKLNGNALLAYAPGIIPGVNVVCPSIRLKTLRDGVEEYEYLRLLSELDGNSERADQVVNSLIKQPFGAHSIGNLDVWDFDPAHWDKKKIELGEMIEKKVND